jgi:hypothetical protein
MTKTKTTPKSGVYFTIYGNAAAYKARKKTAYDLDMGERIDLAMVDFTKRIRDLEEYDKSKA